MGKQNRQGDRNQRDRDQQRHRDQPDQASADQLTPEQMVTAVLADVVPAVLIENHARVAIATARLIERPDVDGWRRAVERILEGRLTTAVSEAWRRGWQPADLGRIAGRRFTLLHLGILADAMAAELSRYAALTIDPRWPVQLDELEAEIWWRPEQTFLRARCEMPNTDWVGVIPLAVELLGLLVTVPKLELLGPLPGTARPPTAPVRTGPTADERVLSRIRALLAKAESTNSPAEAEAFTAGAQERMARHSIDMAMLAAEAPGVGEKPVGRRLGIDAPYESPKAMLLHAVAKANRSRSVWTKRLGFCTVIGFESDLDAVETLFTSLLVQATAAMTRAGSANSAGSRSRTRAFRQSFLTAYASRIGERLAEVTAEQTQAAAAETGSGNLLPVLASRDQAVDAALDHFFPSLTSHSTASVTDAEGWFSGLASADQAVLHTGRAVNEG